MSTYSRVFEQIEQKKREIDLAMARNEALRNKCIEALKKAKKEIFEALKGSV